VAPTPYSVDYGAGNPAYSPPAFPSQSGAGAYAGQPYDPMPGDSSSPAYPAYNGGDDLAMTDPMPGDTGANAPAYDVASAGSPYNATPYGASYPGSANSSAPGMSDPMAAMPGSSYSPSMPDAGGPPSSPYPGGMGPTSESFTTGPAFDSLAGQQQMTWYCSNCNKEVPEHINDRCPHCGVRFDYVEQPDGSRKYNGRLWGGGIGGIIAVVIGVVIRLVIMAQRNA
jgi:hypothetical protein